MDSDAIQKRLHEKFGAAVGAVVEGRSHDSIDVDAGKIDEICAFMRSDPQLKFDRVSNLTGVDHPHENKVKVVYHLHSYEHGHEIVLRVDADRDSPKVATVSAVWPAANWLEREAYDLVGIDFVGHPDLRRILLPDDWIGHPLRKDYEEQSHYHGISTVRESMLRISRDVQ
jgi:NADH-quinone oxidoreductase subunit C